jgi:hypothetical protein
LGKNYKVFKVLSRGKAFLGLSGQGEGRRKKEEGRRKREEGRGKREEGRRKKGERTWG